MTYQGHIVDVVNRRIYDGELLIADGHIAAIREITLPADCADYILPGLIDSHVHIESSMMLPEEFARIVVSHGTIGVVTDPHEIANVLGEAGVEYMIQSGRKVRFNFCFGAPSCVPSCSTDIETSGAVLDSHSIERLMARPEIGVLSEMMNYPGVFANDPEVMAKIAVAKRFGKPVDGHAPGLVGDDRKRYAEAGITTDHECSTLEEGRSCIQNGMQLLIREGSAAKNLEALIPLLKEAPEQVMFCTDDSHPSDLVLGHINRIVSRALHLKYDFWDVLRAATLNPQRHYGLHWGLIQPGDPATFVLAHEVDSHKRIDQTVINGEVVFNRTAPRSQEPKSSTPSLSAYPNRMTASPITAVDITLPLLPRDKVHIIRAEDGSLLTGHDLAIYPDDPFMDTHYPWREVQKIVVYNRYTPGAKPQVALIRGFGLKEGALAASIAHDCHNIVAIGSSDEYLVRAINRIIAMGGGMVAINGKKEEEMSLPIAGIISPLDGYTIARRTALLNQTVAEAGCPMKSPFITMAFMCLPVIPELKLTDKGLFDSARWNFIKTVTVQKS